MTAAAAHLGKTEEVDPRFGSVDCVFFVIGAQKAGTTWLSRFFLEHPAVSVPYWKENNYWNVVESKRICDFIGAPFVPGDIARRRNGAGDSKVPAKDEDRVELAQALKPVYDFAFSRFGDGVPQKWRETAALC